MCLRATLVPWLPCPPAPHLVAEKVKYIRLHVINALKSWLKLRFYDFDDKVPPLLCCLFRSDRISFFGASRTLSNWRKVMACLRLIHFLA